MKASQTWTHYVPEDKTDRFMELIQTDEVYPDFFGVSVEYVNQRNPAQL